MRLRSALVLAALGACASPPPPGVTGRVVVALTVDWEGVELSTDGLRVVDELRTHYQAPITHFVSAAYFTKRTPDPAAAKLIARELQAGDELAVHVHAWRSLAAAAGVTPRVSPSYLTGAAEVAEVDGDAGYETDLDVYSVEELRAIVRTSKDLLGRVGFPVSQSFRAGGFLATPKVVAAIRSEGFTVDSSAISPKLVDDGEDGVLPLRLASLWPTLATTTQPFTLDGAGTPITEVPIAAFAEYSSTEAITALLDDAYRKLAAAPNQDIFLVMGCNLESAPEVAKHISEALDLTRTKHPGDTMLFTTVQHIAERASL